MGSKWVGAGLAGILAVGASAMIVVSAGAAPPGNVDICHATGSASNAYVQNAPNAKGDLQGHAKHFGGVVQSEAEAAALKKAHVDWGDIIPPIPALNFPGLNWTTVGQAIFNNGCKFVAPPSSTTTPPTTTTPTGKVTICHRDNNAKQPYGPKPITISEQGAVNGHAGHTGPIATSVAVAESLKAKGQFWGDIIPPIDPGLPNGLNWPAGQAILANGCQVPGPPPPTTTPPPTTRVPVSTTKPPVSTTKPPVSTTKPPVSTTKPPVSTTRPPVSTTRPAPPTTTLPKVVPVTPAPKTPLAFTGTDTGRIVLVALVMLLIGLVLLARRPRPDRMLAIAAEAPIRPRPTTTSLVDPAPVPDEVEVQASTPEPVADEPWLEFHDAVDDMLQWLDEERARGEEPGR